MFVSYFVSYSVPTRLPAEGEVSLLRKRSTAVTRILMLNRKRVRFMSHDERVDADDDDVVGHGSRDKERESRFFAPPSRFISAAPFDHWLFVNAGACNFTYPLRFSPNARAFA